MTPDLCELAKVASHACAVQEDSRSAYRTVNLKNAALSAAALKAVLAFMYTERLDVAIEEVDAVLRVARKCRMHAMVKAIGEEMRTLKYYFKSTRRDEAPRRLFLFTSVCHQSDNAVEPTLVV